MANDNSTNNCSHVKAGMKRFNIMTQGNICNVSQPLVSDTNNQTGQAIDNYQKNQNTQRSEKRKHNDLIFRILMYY